MAASELGMDTMVSRAAGFSTAQVQDDLMMLNVEQGAYYSLDSIGAEIWKMLEQPATVQALVDQLLQRYKVAPGQCQADVLAFLQEMHKNGMIVVK
jgi:hypothetical protein